MRKLAADQGIKATDALLDELAEAESSLTGEKTNRIKLIEQYGKELVEEAAIRNAVMEYVESQITVKNEESSVIFEQDAKDSATENKSTTKAAEEESIETSEEDSTSASIETKKAE